MCGKVRVGAGTAGQLLCLAALATLAACTGPSLPKYQFSRSEEFTLIAGDSAPTLRFARAAREAGDLQTAIRLYRTLVSEKATAPAIKAEFGDVLLTAKLPYDAINVFNQIPAGSPDHLVALLGLTKAHLALGEPAKALDCADQALATAPHDGRVLVDRGVALDSVQRYAEAQASYRAALAAAPNQVSATNDLALSLAVTGQYDQAIALLTPLARSSTATPRMRENLALIYGLKGDPDRAATLSHADLDESSIRANLEFLAAVRDGRS